MTLDRDAIIIGEAMDLRAAGAEDLRATKEVAWKKLTNAFAISKKDMRDIQKQGMVRSIVNLLYLLVIVGCELDLYGFMMAYQTYWFMGYTIVNVLLILAPVGYLLAILMYMKYSKSVLKENKKKKSTSKRNCSKSPTAKDFRAKRMGQTQPGNNTPSPGVNTPRVRHLPGLKGQRTPIQLEFYHFMPIMRYYLVIKDKTTADVEGIFRVNSLSSFTLGIAQLISIVFQVLVAGNPMTIFVKINIGSQIINWVITILYFITPISDMMGASIKISALANNLKDQLRHIHEQYMEELDKGSLCGNMDEVKKIQKFVDTEIAYIGGFEDADLSHYPMDLKLKGLKLLRLQQINSYSGI